MREHPKPEQNKIYYNCIIQWKEANVKWEILKLEI